LIQTFSAASTGVWPPPPAYRHVAGPLHLRGGHPGARGALTDTKASTDTAQVVHDNSGGAVRRSRGMVTKT